MKRPVLGFALGLFAIPAVAIAQDFSEVPTSPAECVQELRAYRNKAIWAAGLWAPVLPKDSIAKSLVGRAEVCIARFPIEKTVGKQIEALGKIYVVANKDDIARQLFDKRSSDMKATVRERSLTLEAAVEAFADFQQPDRIPHAESYLKKLDAMDETTLVEKFNGHRYLADTYRRLGQNDKLLLHAVEALRIYGTMDQGDRSIPQQVYATFMYQDASEVYYDMPDRTQKMEHIKKLMLNAKEEDFPGTKQELMYAVQRSDMLGTLAPTVVANHWINVPEAKQSQEFGKDGQIRLVQFNAFG